MAYQQLPDIKIGRMTHPVAKFNLDHTVSTTSDFSFVQPVMVHQMLPGSRLVMKNLESFIRLAPVVCPSYADIKPIYEHYFVPTEEIYPAWPYFLAGKPYNNGTTNYIPTALPSVTVRDLTFYTLLGCDWTAYRDTGDSMYEKINSTSAPTEFKWSNGQTVPFSIANNTEYMSYTHRSSIGIDQADFILQGTTQTTGDTLYCFVLSRDKKHLYKVLKGCGFELNPEDNDPKHILHLLSFYKAYYDRFDPKQTGDWTSTAAYKLIEDIRINNRSSLNAQFTSLIDGISPKTNLDGFLMSLMDCYYTLDPDFVSAHISTPSLSSTSSSINVNSVGSLATVVGATAPVNSQPIYADGTGGILASYFSQARLDTLRVLTRFVNKNTVIGGDVDKFLQAHGLGHLLFQRNSNFIGSDYSQVSFGDVMATSGFTDSQGNERPLGDYAGKGQSYLKQDKKQYKTEVDGFWVSMFTIAPMGNWCQMNNPTLKYLTRFEQYFGMNDALGFEITKKDEIVGMRDVSFEPTGEDSGSFGYIPRLSGFKFLPSHISGDISLRGARSSYLPYTLDRFWSQSDVEVTEVTYPGGESNPPCYKVEKYNTPVPIASAQFRYVGKTESDGNFNRVFTQIDGDHDWRNSYQPSRDNFIVHMDFKIAYFAPMLPMSESFDTDENHNTISIKKA